MILDVNALFSEDQDLAQTAAAYLSSNSYDQGAAQTDALGNTITRDAGRAGQEVWAQVTESFSTGSSPTVTFELVMAADAALTSSLVVLCSTPAIAAATLVAGYQFRVGTVPPGATSRYLGARYTIGTATTTTGKISCGFVDAKQLNANYTV